MQINKSISELSEYINNNLGFEIEFNSIFIIKEFCSINNIKHQSILFVTSIEKLQKIEQSISNCLIIMPHGKYVNVHDCAYLKVENPRLVYALIMDLFISSFPKLNPYDYNILSEQNVRIHKSAKVASSVKFGFNVLIDSNAEIAENVSIMSGVIIGSNVKIGFGSIIRENTVIGGQGFGMERMHDNKIIRIPHIGGVVIGANVEIGAINTVCSGTIDPTMVDDYVRTDDHVHIAHNCQIGSGSILTAGTIISGSVNLGKNTWVGPNSTIKDGVTIGDSSFLGVGSVVIKNLDGNLTYAGNPAEEFQNYLNNRTILKKILKSYKNLNDL